MYAKFQQQGLTLIELIMFIIIVSIAITGVLGVMNLIVKSSADPIIRKQSVAMADAIMEEVLAKNYSDPDGTSGETSRISMDDVFDFQYFDGSSNSKKILGSQLLNGSSTQLPDTYWAKVTVTNTTVSAKTMALITVSVTNPQNEVFTITGYRGSY